ncbi:hypothetical protein ACEQUB_01565 [Ralstonia syzygii]
MVALLCVVIILGQNTKALLSPIDNFGPFVATYCGVFLFVAIWLGYRWRYKTRFVRYAQMQFSPRHLQAAKVGDGVAGLPGVAAD